jgi:hypothetical protein
LDSGWPVFAGSVGAATRGLFAVDRLRTIRKLLIIVAS